MEADMGTLTVDPLAIAALIGFGFLLLVCMGLVVFVMLMARKQAGDK